MRPGKPSLTETDMRSCCPKKAAAAQGLRVTLSPSACDSRGIGALRKARILRVEQPHLSILVPGDVMRERALIGSGERIWPEAPVQVVEIQERQRQSGGAGNLLRNCLALGARLPRKRHWRRASEVRAPLTACGAGDPSVLRTPIAERARRPASSRQASRSCGST